jgi:hypothetical protein
VLHDTAPLSDYRHDTTAWRSFDVTAGGDGAGDATRACGRAGCLAFVRSQPLWVAAQGTLTLSVCGGAAWALLPERPHACAVRPSAASAPPASGGDACGAVLLPVPAPGWYIVAGAAASSAPGVLPPALRVTAMALVDAGAAAGDAQQQQQRPVVSSCACGGAPVAAAVAASASPMARSQGAIAYLLSPHNMGELAWSLATLCAATGPWARRYELLFILFPEDVDTLSVTLASPSWRHAARCFRGGVARLMVTDPVVAHRAASASAALTPAAAAEVEAAWSGYAAHAVRSRFSVGYRKMVWFWSFGLLADARFSQYRYIWRLDTDSELLASLREDVFAHMAASRAVLGYHCWTYEAPPVARGFMAAAGAAAAAAGALPGAWGGAYAAASAAGDAGAPAGMFYNNFMIVDTAHFSFAARPAAARALAPLLGGVLAHRWGDALVWGALAALFANATSLWHVDGLAYNHGRGYTQMLLPGNAERVAPDYGAWAATHPGGPRGGCTDPRVRWTHRVALKLWRAAHGVV